MKFTVEKKSNIVDNDLKIVRNLYTPIIGSNSSFLYGLLVDYADYDSRIISFYPLKDLLDVMGISKEELMESKKKLEAVGLIRTYEKSDNFHFLFSINKPLSIVNLRKNNILFRLITKKISIEAFERFEYSYKTKVYDKSEYSEITLKFQDLFTINNEKNNVQNTLELPTKMPESIDDAVLGLAPAQFVAFLTNKRVQKSMLELLNELVSHAFSSRSVNLIIKYSFDVNGKVVKNHVKTIALDLLNKDATTFTMVGEELTLALNNKTKEFIDVENNKPKKSQIDINDVYGQIGDL